MEVEMQDFILFTFATIGMAHIIVDGSIMEPFRRFFKNVTQKIGMPKIGDVVECYMCCGTWCGFFMGYILFATGDNLAAIASVVFACGCAGGFLSNFAAMILNWIESATIINMPQEKPDNNE